MATATGYETREHVSVGVSGGRVSKVQRYGWILRDRPGEFMMIDKSELRIDHDYQRDKVIVRKVREIQANWSWVGCGCILVAMRPDGTLWVFDGQHRVLASRNRADISVLPCLVFEMDAKTQEAAGFLVSNTQRKPVPAIAKFKALVMTGDAAAVAVDSVFKRMGLTISDNCHYRNEIKCVSACLKHAANDPDTFEMAIKVAMSLEENEPVHRDMLDGLVWLQQKYKLLDDQRFVRRFSSISRHDILASMQKFAIAQEKKGERVCGIAILQCVNKGLRQRFGDLDD